MKACHVCFVLCFLFLLRAGSQTIDPKQTEEYTNLLKIIKAYELGEPAKVQELQTSTGKNICDELYAQHGYLKFSAPELVGFGYAHRFGWFGNVQEDNHGDEHRLKFVFENAQNSSLQRKIIKATFYREHGVWCFHDIIFDENKYVSALSPTELTALLKINSNAIDLIKAAHIVMVTPPNDFVSFKTAITQVQEMAQFNGFGQHKEVRDFIVAAERLEAFAVEWNQTIESVSSDKFSLQLDSLIAAKVHASFNGVSSAGGGAETKMESQLKKEIESTLRQTMNALNPKDADEYGLRMDKLRETYNAVLKLIDS